jgi:methionyl aminopeptidase
MSQTLKVEESNEPINQESESIDHNQTDVEPSDPYENFTSHSSNTTWKFEYNPMQNIFRTDHLEDIDNDVFVKYDGGTKVNAEPGENVLTDSDLADFRRAALIHRLVRSEARQYLYPGGKVADLVDAVEAMTLRLTKQNPETYYMKGSAKGTDAGIAFPVGVNINNVVAHDSKTTVIKDNRKFTLGDVVKVDIGVHNNGRIIDSAFTHIVSTQRGVSDPDNLYNTVLEASRDSVFSTIKLAGPDQSLYELSENIEEIINSYELDVAGSTMPIRPVEGIGGHNILKHQIHGGKLILCVPDEELQGELRMREDEVYAIETYASTGLGQITQNDTMAQCTHFMETEHDAIEKNRSITKKDKKHFRKLPFYKWMQTRKGLPFSSSWLQDGYNREIPKMDKAFKAGIATGQMVAYPPLNDEPAAVVAQFEHTIHLGSRGRDTVEIFSLGEDY